ncbi:hypothetical protein HWV62_40752 [Athelia sp. TMB]|nr:hypothetical protein HWV62_40752 [Athelia sp. TMB]
MFKGILPSKRIQSGDFTMVAGPGIPGELPYPTHVGKENQPDLQLASQPANSPNATKSAGKGTKSGSKQKNGRTKESDAPKSQVEEDMTEDAFDKLLDDLQIPFSLRPKLATMDSTVKAAMLKSSQVLTLTPAVPTAPPSPPPTPRTLRKAHSSDSLSSPRPQNSSQFDLHRPHIGGFLPGSALGHNGSTSIIGLNALGMGTHGRGQSFDVGRTTAFGQNAPVIPSEYASRKLVKDKALAISPSRFCSILTGTSSTLLEVETIKKLRLLLRNESAKEEQHDDQILYELLRCMKALSTSEIGCFALRSSCPTPFVQLVSLLYSDKKPGDVACRQLIVELLLVLFDLYPSVPAQGRSNGSSSSRGTPASSTPALPAPHDTFYSLIRALILTPAPAATESPAAPVSPHAFISSLHTPRIYKTYLQELSDICRDYFWVFCHPNNTLWNLHDVDEGKVEKPRAPGGMTGGVEFEAMAYMTTHMKLVNAISRAAADLNLPKEYEHSAYRFHQDLFASGIERILLIARKASTAYYPTLHLELSRYLQFVAHARLELPWTLSRLMGPPPTAMCKPGRGSLRGSPGGQVTPSKRPLANGLVQLPSPQSIEPISFN